MIVLAITSQAFLIKSYGWENFPDDIDLSYYEKSVYSQQGEDGIIEKIFDLIGVSSKYYVEFGAKDGHHLSNTKLLREKHGWKGLLLDDKYIDKKINLYKEFITAENINELFRKYNVPEDFDLLSIDIDYNDFHIWNAIDPRYRPRVVIIEYNATHLPNEDKVVKYEPYGFWDRSNYYGASILALYRLGRKKGYSLVYAEKNGINLFFIREDRVLYPFKNINNVKKIYRKSRFEGPNGGHKKDFLFREYISSGLER